MPFDGFNQFTQIVSGNSQVPRSQPCLGIDLGAADMICTWRRPRRGRATASSLRPAAQTKALPATCVYVGRAVRAGSPQRDWVETQAR